MDKIINKQTIQFTRKNLEKIKCLGINPSKIQVLQIEEIDESNNFFIKFKIPNTYGERIICKIIDEYDNQFTLEGITYKLRIEIPVAKYYIPKKVKENEILKLNPYSENSKAPENCFLVITEIISEDEN